MSIFTPNLGRIGGMVALVTPDAGIVLAGPIPAHLHFPRLFRIPLTITVIATVATAGPGRPRPGQPVVANSRRMVSEVMIWRMP